jgi:hypothetical protein
VSPVKYELGSYIPGDGILHSNSSENLISYIAFSLSFMTPCNLTGSYQ